MSKRTNRRLTSAAKARTAALVLICAQSFLGAHADGTHPAGAPAALAPLDATDAAYRQGHDSYEKKNYAEALRWYRLAAARSLRNASFELADDVFISDSKVHNNILDRLLPSRT